MFEREVCMLVFLSLLSTGLCWSSVLLIKTAVEEKGYGTGIIGTIVAMMACASSFMTINTGWTIFKKRREAAQPVLSRQEYMSLSANDNFSLTI